MQRSPLDQHPQYKAGTELVSFLLHWDALPHAVCAAGALLKAIGRRVLHLVLLQYVDDYYGPEQRDCVQHAMEVFARHPDRTSGQQPLAFTNARRLVRACLGKEAVQPRKLQCGLALEVLGVDIRPQLSNLALIALLRLQLTGSAQKGSL